MCPTFGQIYSTMKEREMAIPHLFLCPISLDLFTDPVTLCTGQTYDRPSIEKWLSAGNSTCPVTMQKLSDKSMVPNHTLHHLIDRWLIQSSQKSHSNHSKIPPQDLSSIFSLKHVLESHHSPIDTKLQTLGSLKIMSQELPTNNSFLIQPGFFKSITDQVFNENETQKCFPLEYNEFIKELLTLALKLMPYCSLAPLNMLRDEQKFDQFLFLFDHGTVAIKNDLCQLIESISSSSETKELCSDLGKKQTLLQRLVLLIQESTEASDYGIKAILALCSVESNRVYLVREGIVNGLMAYISNSGKNETNLCAKAMNIIQMVIGLEGVKEGLIDDERGVKAMVKMVFRVCDHEGSESAIDVLMGLCSDSVVVRERAIFGGVLSQLLLLIQSQCGGRVKNKARVLLKLLRSMWNQDLAHM